MTPGGTQTAAAGLLLEELREVVRSRGQHARALWAAVACLTSTTLFESLAAIVDALPLVIEADSAAIRIADDEGNLHLLAASGLAMSEIRVRALRPIELKLAARLAGSSGIEQHMRLLGFQWVDVRWFGAAGSPSGIVVLASRTHRRPHSHQLRSLDELVEQLTAKFLTVDRTPERLRSLGLRLIRAIDSCEADGLALDEAASLRPRERTILDLYADGLTTSEIAALLFISPHTVRTHVKTALRTLGLHSRAEAARLVRANQAAWLP